MKKETAEALEELRHKAEEHFLVSVENLDAAGLVIQTNQPPEHIEQRTTQVRFTFDDGEQFLMAPFDLITLAAMGICPVLLPKHHIN